MEDLAVCIPVFERTAKTRDLLESIETTDIQKVYIADDGKDTPEKQKVYSRDWEFDLEVFNLDFDAGVGEKRNILAKKPKEEFLLFIDSDMKIPRNYKLLLNQLKARPNLGGVCGMYLEDGRVSTVSTDFYEEKNRLVRGVRERKNIEFIEEAPFIQFDFHPQVGIFRKECLNDYNWDKKYTIMREHVDFFLGHYKKTDWVFGLSPEVYFRHNPGGSEYYDSHRNSDEKRRNSHKYFCEKWGYDDLVIEQDRSIDTYIPKTDRSDKIRKRLTALRNRIESYF
jgi:glycosyltransferase involved in cell wall biosynthesis